MIEPLENIHKILVINLAFIGDVLLSAPVLKALRQQYPTAVIHMLTVPVTAEIAAALPGVDEVVVYDKRGKHKKVVAFLALLHQLRREQYDLAVCTNHALRGAVVAWAAGIPYRAGYDAQHGSCFLSHVASSVRTSVRHESENYLEVLRPLGIAATDTQLALNLPSGSRDYAQRVLQESGAKPLVLLCPYGSYPRKSWPDRDYVALLKQLKNSFSCYLIGSRAEGARLTALQRAGGLAARQVLAGSASLVEVAALIQAARVLVTVDTGPLHIAQAVHTPVIALFGPTDPAIWGPRGIKDVVFYHETVCSPCWGKGECLKQVCMQSADVDKVAQTLFQLLEVN